jgi:hypothetical protein
MKKSLAPLLLAAALCARPCLAVEELITTARYAGGEPVPYILDTGSEAPKYLVILFPGGAGNVDPRIENGVLVYGYKGDFLVRSR